MWQLVIWVNIIILCKLEVNYYKTFDFSVEKIENKN